MESDPWHPNNEVVSSVNETDKFSKCYYHDYLDNCTFT